MDIFALPYICDLVTCFVSFCNPNYLYHITTVVIPSMMGIGKSEYAARFMGWADDTRNENGNKRPLSEQANVDKYIAACLVTMGEVVFSDAYDEGQVMTLEETAEYAMEM